MDNLTCIIIYYTYNYLSQGDTTSLQLPSKCLDMDLATNVDEHGMAYPQRSQRTPAVPITTGSHIPTIGEQTPRKSHRRIETCFITLSPYKRALELKKKASNIRLKTRHSPGRVE